MQTRVLFSLTPALMCAVLTSATQAQVISNNLDGGSGSLRQTIADATNGATLTFAPSLAGQTIVLTNGQITVTNNLTIDASAIGGITIDGNGLVTSNRIFELVGSSVELDSLVLQNGLVSGERGGAISIDSGSTLTIGNTIIAGNTASSGTNNLFGSISSGTNNLVDVDPLLAPLGDYGGPTQTMPPLPGSPAIDAGFDTGSLPATDQRGLNRVVNGIVDIGAVEVQLIVGTAPLVVTDLTVLGDGTFQFAFTNLTGATFTVFASTNVALPLTSWSNVGPAVELPPGSGQFQFNDPDATNFTERYYRVKSP